MPTRTDDVFFCPQSRHSGIDDREFERAEAASVLRPLAYSAEAGHTIFESADSRLLMHLGHPDYEPERLAFEYLRDVRAGRLDVEAPRHLDVENPLATWRGPAEFFTGWTRSLGLSRDRNTSSLPAERCSCPS